MLTRCGHGVERSSPCLECQRIDALRRGEDAPFVGVEPVKRRESRWPRWISEGFTIRK